MRLVGRFLVLALGLTFIVSCSDTSAEGGGTSTPSTQTAVPQIKMTCGSNSCIQ